MAAALTLLLIGSLLQGSLCGEFKAFMPQTIEVFTGSCVTIPCSFDVKAEFESYLDHTCRAIWIHDKETVFDSCCPQTPTNNGELIGDLTKKNCTTTLNNMQPTNNKHIFRVECDNSLKYNFKEQISISVSAVPPRPTLTPSAVKVEEGTSVSLTCSAPAPCRSHPPTLTWSDDLGLSVETLQENQDRTTNKISVVTFTASHKHHGKTLSCTASYYKQDGRVESAVSMTADISYSPQNTTVSVHPSGPVPEGGDVTLTCSSTANPPVKSYTWYRADGAQETFSGTGDVLNIKALKVSGSFFCKAENNIGVGRSGIIHIDVQFAPQILSSSACIKAADQLNCSCRTVGNPSPTLRWYLDGSPVNHSDTFVKEHLNGTDLWSIISVDGPRQRNLSSVLCRSSNSLGSDSQRFCVNRFEPQTSAESPDRVTLPVFISTVAALLVLVCVLLFVNRAQKAHHNRLKSQCTADTSTVTMSHLQASGEGNEVPNTTEEDTYALAHAATLSEPNSNSSEKRNEEGNDVIYSAVNWTAKSKKKKAEDSVDMHQPGGSYPEEEMCMVGGMRRSFVNTALEMGNLYDNVGPRKVEKEVESEYAQVQFKDKRAMRK